MTPRKTPPGKEPALVPDEITREPFRQYQGGTEVTKALTGVTVDLELCAVCSQNRGVGDHHITFRSAGGSDGPTLPLCLRCHNHIHDREWFLEVVDRGLEISDSEGDLIWRLYAWPLAGDAGEFVQMLQTVAQTMAVMPDMASALLPWQAAEMFRALRDLGEGGWRAQARLIGEWSAYRCPGLSLQDKIPVISELFGIRKSQCYNYMSVATAFKDSDVLEWTELSMGYAIEAARTTDPVAWLTFAQERKLEHPQFTRDDLKTEIKRAGVLKFPPAESDAGGDDKTRVVWAKCNKCGAVDWMEKLPVGSDGKPINVEDYSGECEQA